MVEPVTKYVLYYTNKNDFIKAKDALISNGNLCEVRDEENLILATDAEGTETLANFKYEGGFRGENEININGVAISKTNYKNGNFEH